MKDKKFYGIIILYGLILTLCLLGVNNMYGSSVDWLTQHTIIPEHFRNSFYETGKLIPNFVFNLGAGQNIFNFSYYGLVSPLILLSYLLPFIKMEVYISIISIILYLVSGILVFKFFNYHELDKKTCLFSSLVFLTLPPITYHFHYHVMFVWYFPFLILSFMGVDRYVNSNKSFLLIISVFLLILTNYYYSLPSIIAVSTYGIFCLLKKYNIRKVIENSCKASIKIFISILMACFILLPTFYVIVNTGRVNNIDIGLLELIVFDMDEIMYQSFSMGLSFFLVIVPFGNLCVNKRSKADLFLNLVLILITFIPIFMYLFNGFLYVRGKVLIPFALLYLVSFLEFIQKLIDGKVNLKKLHCCIFFVMVILVVSNFNNSLLLWLIIDFLITYFSIVIFNKKGQVLILFVPLILIFGVSSFGNNLKSKYVSISDYNEYLTLDDDINMLMKNRNDTMFYRVDTTVSNNRNMNRVLNFNDYGTSIYSSSYNSYYRDFYNDRFGNNISHRNYLMTSDTNNSLFLRFMGVRYIISNQDDVGLNYNKINSYENLGLYYNENVYPIMYATNDYGYANQYNSMKFPYNMEYMANYAVVDEKGYVDYESGIMELELDLEDEYRFTLDKTITYDYKLSNSVINKYLIITFDMNYNQSCDMGDVSISINGVENKLTCKEWPYHNNNNSFEYVISSNYPLEDLKIELTKGEYYISNIHVYTMENIYFSYQEIDNIFIDKANSIITGDVNLDRESYIVTSFPYDDGFSIYVDDKEVSKEIVNTSFLGFKVSKGKIVLL